jgi:hypothetical protein
MQCVLVKVRPSLVSAKRESGRGKCRRFVNFPGSRMSEDAIAPRCNTRSVFLLLQMSNSHGCGKEGAPVAAPSVTNMLRANGAKVPIARVIRKLPQRVSVSGIILSLALPPEVEGFRLLAS